MVTGTNGGGDRRKLIGIDEDGASDSFIRVAKFSGAGVNNKESLSIYSRRAGWLFLLFIIFKYKNFLDWLFKHMGNING